MDLESIDDNRPCGSHWTDEFATTATDAKLGIDLRNGQIVFPRHHVNRLGRAMLRAGTTGGSFGFDHAEILKKLHRARAHRAALLNTDRLDGASRADLRAVRTIVGTERHAEVLIGLQKSGKPMSGDRWDQHLIRAIRHAQMAGGAAALEMRQ